jgi:TAT (twin-arginine translocation) pathway signal sequence
MDRRDVLKGAALTALGIGLSSVPQSAATTEKACARRDQMSNVNESVVR